MIVDLVSWPFRVALFVLWFTKEVIVSTFAVLRDIASPGTGSTPRVVRLELGRTRDPRVLGISTLITLTPGTLTMGTCDSGAGRRALLVHSLYHADTDSCLSDLQDMDQRMVGAVRLRRQP